MEYTLDYLLANQDKLFLVDNGVLADSKSKYLQRKAARQHKNFEKLITKKYQTFGLNFFNKRALSFLAYLEHFKKEDNPYSGPNNIDYCKRPEIAHMIDLLINAQDRQQCWMIFKMYTSEYSEGTSIVSVDELKADYPVLYNAILHAHAYDDAKVNIPYKHPNGRDITVKKYSANALNVLYKLAQTIGRNHPDKLRNQWVALEKGDPANLNELLKTHVIITDPNNSKTECSFYEYLVKKNYKLVNCGQKWQIINIPVPLTSHEQYDKSILPILIDKLNRQSRKTKIAIN